MHRSDFAYALPKARIAQAPLPEREGARLLHVAESAWTHRHVADLPSLLRPRDLVVVNNTRVLNARLRGVKDSGGGVEVLLERIETPDTALCQVRSSKPLQPGRTLAIGGERLVAIDRAGEFHRLRFPVPVINFLERFGETPLPPYIDRSAQAADRQRYQTVYARVPGAVAAPTAGLHLSDQLLERIEKRCAGVAEVTLHVGAGTFQPVRTENLAAHRLHSERYEVTESAAARIQACRDGGGRVVAVGTTVVRTLETVADKHGRLCADAGETRLFIKPGFRFRAVDALLTNFHLPESSLLMLVCAFAGHRRTLRAYECAVREGYRFFSYGDAMFTERVADA